MALDIDPALWRSFVAVADSGGFTRAARRLSRTQSAVSMQIKRLEQATGTSLFRRDSIAVSLTRDGEGLLAHARRILALNDEAVNAASGRAMTGLVRLGVMDDYASEILPPMLARFQRAHAAIDIEVHTGLTGFMHERLGRDLDLVLAMHPAGTGSGTVLRREAAVWAGARGGTAHRRDPLPLALYPQGCLFRDWAMRALDRAGRTWRLAYMSPSLAAVAAAAASGLAIGVFKAGTMPRALARLDRRHGLPALPVAEIALHRAGGLTRPATGLADFLEKELRQSIVNHPRTY
jgi:DNA-binding transcriptional LysR family regulator